jgi:hypothetical protein
MKTYTTIVAAMFGLLMMAMPNVASAEVLVRPVRPPVVQQVVAPAPFTTIEYYRPWACANPHYRRHHWWRCH